MALLGLTILHFHIQMPSKRAMFSKSEVSAKQRAVQTERILTAFRRYPVLLILRDCMTMNFHFDNKFGTRWGKWYTDRSFKAVESGRIIREALRNLGIIPITDNVMETTTTLSKRQISLIYELNVSIIL